MLDELVASRYALELEARTEVTLPAYPGSTFRGALGRSFRQVACTLRLQECGTCLLRSSCSYSLAFETPVPDDAAIMRLYPYAPHPFILEPPAAGGRVEPGEKIQFCLVLVGRGRDFLPYFIYAMELMCERGLGRGRGRCRLNTVHTRPFDGSQAMIVYDGNEKRLYRVDAAARASTIDERVREVSSRHTLALVFDTPTRIKYRGRYIDRPEMSMIVPSLMRRLTALAYFHCDAPFQSDVAAQIKAGKNIELLQCDTHWHDWERHSSRQNARMRLGGFVGKAVYRGDFTTLAAPLVWGEVLHVGKGSSFGLGNYRIVLDQEDSGGT